MSQGTRGVASFTLMWAQRKKKSQRIRALVFFRMFINQLCSINRAISPRQSEQTPTSNKSPALTTPEKLVIVTAWPHLPHQTLESNFFRASGGMAAHNLAAGSVNLGMDSVGMTNYKENIAQSGCQFWAW